MEVFEEGRGQHFGCTGQSGAEIGTYICAHKVAQSPNLILLTFFLE